MWSNHQPSNENHDENWRSLDANEITEELVSWHWNGNIILLPSVDTARHSSRFSRVHLAQSFARSVYCRDLDFPSVDIGMSYVIACANSNYKRHN